MAYQGINTGTSPNSGTGDTLLSGAEKINSNFIELFTVVGLGSTGTTGVGTTGVVTSIIGGDNIGVSTNTGAVTVSAVGVITSVVSGTNILVTTNSGVSTISLSDTANVRAETLVVSGVSTLTNLGVSGLSTFTNLVVSGVSTFTNNVVLGNNSANRVTINGLINSALTPDLNQIHDLGAPADKWNNVYASVGNFINIDANTISAASSITADNGFYGDGSGLTNLPTGITTSNVSANTLVVAGVSTLGVVNANIVNSTVFGGDGSTLSNIPTSIIAGDNISVSGSTGNVTITGLANTANVVTNTLVVSGVSTLGVVTGATYYGDGSGLTNLPAGITTSNVSANTLVVTGVSTLTNVVVGTTTDHTLTVTGKVDSNLIPALNQTYNIGKFDGKWNNIYGNIVHSTILTTNTVSASSSITANNGFYGDGSNLTGIANTSNINTDSINVAGVTTSSGGFSSGTGSPVKISVVGTTLTFTVDGIGSTSLTLS